MTEWSAGVARVDVATHSGGNPHENGAQSRYVLLTSLAPPVQQACVARMDKPRVDLDAVRARTVARQEGGDTVRIIIPARHAFPDRRILSTALMVAGLMTGACHREEAAPVVQKPPEVMVANVERRDVPIAIELVGQTKGAQDVEVRARVEGFLDDVTFQEGTVVNKGQPLYRIDAQPFEALLANATADLATAQARFTKAQNDVKRLEPLAAKQAVTQQELDDAIALREAAEAQVAAQKASVEKARLDVGYTVVNSPITGLAGTTLIRAGALVGRGESTLLTTVSQIDPILFTAGISEAEYLRIGRRAEQLRRQRAGRPVQVELMLADGTVHPQKGRLDAVERAVDTSTGTLSLQFRFPNSQGLIRPGQYGRVHFVLETKKDALLVPQRAVQELQNLYNVTVVGADNKLITKTVTVGPRVGSQWMIDSGLDPSDRVVVEGAQRLKPGTLVASKEAPASPAATSGTAEPLPVAPPQK